MAKPKNTAGGGYGKPPVHARFKPGQSGNPGGRKKGSTNLKTLLQTVLESEIELTENGRKRKVPLIQALLLRQAQDGLQGQTRAIENLLDRYERHCGDREDAPEELAADDEAVLTAALARKLRRAAPDRDGEGGRD